MIFLPYKYPETNSWVRERNFSFLEFGFWFQSVIVRDTYPRYAAYTEKVEGRNILLAVLHTIVSSQM